MADGLAINVEIYGIKEALKELNKVAPTMRRQITKDAKREFKGVLDQLSDKLPNTPPLSGMNAKWRQGAYGPRAGRQGRQLLPTTWAKVAKGTVKIDTRGARRRNRMTGAEYESLSVFAFAWNDPIASVLEFTGTGKKPYKGRSLAQSDNFVKQISQKASAPAGKAKFVWHAVDNNPSIQRNIEESMERVLDDAIKIINAELGKNLGRK